MFVQNSLEKFYLRMNKAREVKEEEEDFQRNMCGTGNNWVKQTTVPSAPTFGLSAKAGRLQEERDQRKTIKALGKF